MRSSIPNLTHNIQLLLETEKKAKCEQDMKKQELLIKELETKNEQQSKMLKRKTEEVVAAHKKLRAGANTSMG